MAIMVPHTPPRYLLTRIVVPAAILCGLVQNLWGQIPDRSLEPTRIMLNLTATPAVSMAVNWQTATPVSGASVEFALATDGTEFRKPATTLSAKTETRHVPGGLDVTFCSAVIEGLRPATAYVYRVGSKGAWSSWNQFRTADDR